jgi:hypothetical protein
MASNPVISYSGKHVSNGKRCRNDQPSTVSWGGVGLSPHGTPATVWPTVPAPDGGR